MHNFDLGSKIPTSNRRNECTDKGWWNWLSKMATICNFQLDQLFPKLKTVSI